MQQPNAKHFLLAFASRKRTMRDRKSARGLAPRGPAMNDALRREQVCLARWLGFIGCILGTAWLAPHGLGQKTEKKRPEPDSRVGQLFIFENLKAPVTSMAVSKDGLRALVGGKTGAVQFLDLDNGTELRAIQGPPMQICCLAFSADGRSILAGGKSGTLVVWDAETGKERQRWEGHRDMVECVVFLGDGKRAVSGSGGVDHTMRQWEIEGGKELKQSRFNEKAAIYALTFSLDGRAALT